MPSNRLFELYFLQRLVGGHWNVGGSLWEVPSPQLRSSCSIPQKGLEDDFLVSTGAVLVEGSVSSMKMTLQGIRELTYPLPRQF